MKKVKKVVKKVVKKKFPKLPKAPAKAKEEMLFVAGYITKGRDKGKYAAVQVRNTMNMNPIEPIFEANPGMEYVVVGKDEAKVKDIFAKIVNISSIPMKVK